MTRVTESLERTSFYAGHVTTQMDIVVEAVEKQTAAIAQVTEGVDQISAVVQTNSATAQASGLKQLVDRFTLASDF